MLKTRVREERERKRKKQIKNRKSMVRKENNFVFFVFRHVFPSAVKNMNTKSIHIIETM